MDPLLDGFVGQVGEVPATARWVRGPRLDLLAMGGHHAELQSRGWQKALRYWVENRATLLSPFELEDLRREGLTDPAGQLRDSLAAHPELIPYDAVLGGTMLFSPGEGVVLLGRPYVFADFGDGHIGGKMLVEYSVAPGPRIIWKLLWAQPEP